VIVTTVQRKLLAFLSACGLAASILAYIGSFFGAPVDKILPWALLLIPGWMVLIAPIFVLEYPASRAPSFAWKGFVRGMPRWVSVCTKLFSFVALGHLVWGVLKNGPGVAAIVDGQYVLASRGRILKVLTGADYLRLRGGDLRVLATIMISFYFAPMVYWWFWRNRQHADPNP
jgi:hypothetical protein